MGSIGEEQRDLRANHEDRLSKLPDDVIHHILSTVDTKDVVRTSLLSTRWKNIWKSTPYLNFNRRSYHRMPDFSKYVTQYLKNRHNSGISVINVMCEYGSIDPSLVRKISSYAISHGSRELSLCTFVSRRGSYQIRLSNFSSGSLQCLVLNSVFLKAGKLPKASWNLPALTTLILSGVSFEFCCNDGTKSIDIFSNLLNLKRLTLIECYATGLEIFKITSPRLEYLSISSNYWEQKRFDYVILAPNLMFLDYIDYNPVLSKGPYVIKAHAHVEINPKKKEIKIVKHFFFMMELRNLECTILYREPTSCKEITNICNGDMFQEMLVVHNEAGLFNRYSQLVN